MTIFCSGCDVPIEPFTKYLCVYKTPDGFRVAVGCGHYTPSDGWDYVFGGSQCFTNWIEDFKFSLRKCNHKEDEDVPTLQ